MLEGLDQIDWKSRNAENVPLWLRQLVSADKAIRIDGFNQLDDNVVFGGVDFQEVDLGYGISKILATDTPKLIISFLFELLEHEQVEGKEDVLSLLIVMANYVNLNDEGEIYATRAKELREAIWDGAAKYRKLLNHERSRVKLATADLLCNYPEHFEVYAADLFQLLESENEVIYKASLVSSIYKAWSKSNKLSSELNLRMMDILHGFLQPPHKHRLRITAAICLIDQLRDDAPEEAVDYLIEAMIDPFTQEILISGVSFMESAGTQSDTLIKLGVERGVRAASVITKYSKEISKVQSAAVTALILAFSPESIPSGYSIVGSLPIFAGNEVIFPHDWQPPKPNVDVLTEMQKHVLNAIVESDHFWDTKSNILENFGLPTTRKALYKLIQV